MRWFCNTQFPHKSVNVSVIITNIKNKLTNVCGNRLLQNKFMNTACEITSAPQLGGGQHAGYLHEHAAPASILRADRHHPCLSLPPHWQEAVLGRHAEP